MTGRMKQNDSGKGRKSEERGHKILFYAERVIIEVLGINIFEWRYRDEGEKCKYTTQLIIQTTALAFSILALWILQPDLCPLLDEMVMAAITVIIAKIS